MIVINTNSHNLIGIIDSIEQCEVNISSVNVVSPSARRASSPKILEGPGPQPIAVAAIEVAVITD
jgi:hypothetical protein